MEYYIQGICETSTCALSSSAPVDRVTFDPKQKIGDCKLSLLKLTINWLWKENYCNLIVF